MEPYTLIEDKDIPGKYKISSDVGFINKDAQKKVDEKWKLTDWENQIYGGDKSDINNSLPYIGFMQLSKSKSSDISFKLKKLFRSDKTPIKSVTSLNATNAYNKNKNIIKNILDIYESRKDKGFIEGVSFNILKKPKPSILSSYIEIIMRYLNHVENNNNNKVKWFFNSTESLVYQINNFPKNVQNPDKKNPTPSWFKN